jgi:serine protease
VSCAGLVCSFDASTSSDDVGITRYRWGVTGGGSGSGATFTAKFAAESATYVILTVWDAAGEARATVRLVTCSATACR